MFVRAAAGMLAAALLAGCAPTTAERYDAMTAAMERRGLMRTEIAPADALFGNAELIRNFERIAFFSEFAEPEDGPEGVRLVERVTPSPLFRWTGPVRWKIEGDGADEADRAAMRRLAGRLAAATGLVFEEVEADPNMAILIASDQVRRDFVGMIREAGLESRMALAKAWARQDRFPCVGQIGSSGAGADRQVRALVLIKAETQGVLREACLHEEVAQSLGLPNDDFTVRPSIFNDDQEFALLTAHDAWLLRILYDPRLRHGMEAAEGMPIVRRIVAEIGPDRGGRLPPGALGE